MQRRTFVKGSLAALGASLVDPRELARAVEAALAEGAAIPKRRLGRTNLQVTILGLPGWHIGRMRSEAAALDMIARALDLGINFFDSAPSYNDGESERRLGKGLRGRREKIFLMTKTLARRKSEALAELDASLGRLQTGYLDLWQFHALGTPDEVDTVWGAGGAIEAALEAKRAGKIRHFGFTGHRDARVHLKAVEEHHDLIETVQMPINPVDPHYESFTRLVLPEAARHNLGVIAMKTVANGALVEDKVATPAECHRFAWSQTRPADGGAGVSTLVAGMDTPAQLDDNVAQALAFTPYSESELAALLERTRPFAGIQTEAYKAPSRTWRTYPAQPVL
jgi:aryl-alcohol dehydrogenase-like predicted oxidoreductase